MKRTVDDGPTQATQPVNDARNVKSETTINRLVTMKGNTEDGKDSRLGKQLVKQAPSNTSDIDLPPAITVKRSVEEEAARLSEVLCIGSTSDVTAALERLSDEDLNEACTTITASGHTVVHILTQRQKVTSLQAVLKRGVDVNTRNAQGTTPIHLALQHNALSSAKVLIDHRASVSEVISRRKGTTLLHMLVMCDRPMAVKLLLAEGAEVDCRDLQDRTALHLAAIYGNLRIADILLQHEGCNVNIPDGTGQTPLMLAILNGNAELSRHLSAALKTDVSLKNRDGMSALHLAVALGQVDVARAILNRNTANINSKERSMGRTPLHFACSLTASTNDMMITADDITNRNGDASSYLSGTTESFTSDDALHRTADRGAEGNGAIDSVDKNGNAVEDDSGNEEHVLETVIKAISQNGVTTNRAAKKVNAHSASKKSGKMKDERQLKANGDSNDISVDSVPSKPTKNGVSIRSGSSFSRTDPSSPAPAKEPQEFQPGNKLRPKASLAPAYHERSRVPKDNHTVRRPATASARLSTTRATSAKTRREFSPQLSLSSSLHSLSSKKEGSRRESCVSFVLTPSNVGAVRCKMAALLLDHGADANLMTLFRKSALHIVAAIGASDVMALLLPHTTNTNMLSASNKTALHLAVEGNHITVVSQLVHAGANLGLRDMAGMTALHMAARLGHADIVLLLLRGKAKKNSSDFKQMTPLHHACQNGHTEVADILIKAGCRTDLVDDQGLLALNYANNNCIAKKDENEHNTKAEDKHAPITDEVKPEIKRQRKKGAVYLLSSTLPTHVDV